MFKFNTDSIMYGLALDGISLIVGTGVDLLVKTICNGAISDRAPSKLSALKMHLGSFGIRSVASCHIAHETRKTLDKMCKAWNELADICDMYANYNPQPATESQEVANESEVAQNEPIDISNEVD